MHSEATLPILHPLPHAPQLCSYLSTHAPSASAPLLSPQRHSAIAMSHFLLPLTYAATSAHIHPLHLPLSPQHHSALTSFSALQLCSYPIQQGCTLSRATVHWFKHNDMADLERVLKLVDELQAAAKWVGCVCVCVCVCVFVRACARAGCVMVEMGTMQLPTPTWHSLNPAGSLLTVGGWAITLSHSHMVCRQ